VGAPAAVDGLIIRVLVEDPEVAEEAQMEFQIPDCRRQAAVVLLDKVTQVDMDYE
jgi:hypothetical protein